MKCRGEKITALTAYDALLARLLDDSTDLILVGDSVGMVVGGHETTLPVTLEQMIYHTQNVRRGSRRSFLTADMPFMSYQVSPGQALENAGRLIKEGGAEAVKMEGGRHLAETVRRCTESGIPVMGHLGLTPQSIHAFGGWQTRAKQNAEAERLREDAHILRDAGIFALVLEKIPASLAKNVTESLDIPTIGIGAGPGTDGQILVTQDLLGMFEEFKPKFVRRYADLGKAIRQAVENYADDVKKSRFPAEDESF